MQQTFSLTSAELLAVIEDFTGDRLGVDSESARAELRDRGLLITAPLEDSVGVNSELAWLVDALLRPKRASILRTPQGITYIVAGVGGFAVNSVGPDGQHKLTRADAFDDALEALLPTANGAAGGSEDVATLVREAQTFAVLVTAEADLEPRSLSWIIARDGIWLVDPTSEISSPRAENVSRAKLRERIRGHWLT